MAYATNDGVEIFYEEDGPADGDPVVFVEGLAYGTWMWNWQRDPLSESYRTVVLDNRGTGNSDTPEGPYTVAEMAGDVGAVLDDAGLDDVHLVGASLGGMIAQEFALTDDRVRSLSLLCTHPAARKRCRSPTRHSPGCSMSPRSTARRRRSATRCNPPSRKSSSRTTPG